MSEHHQKQVSFWKKHQTILKKCADLSTECGVKILVCFLVLFWCLCDMAHCPSLLQCVITVPDKYAQDPKTQQTLSLDNRTGDMRVRNTSGTTVVFDSFSSEQEVRLRNPITNSISRINDTSRHFLANVSINVVGPVAAILSPSMVASYQTVDHKASGKKAKRKEPEPLPVAKRSVHIVTKFDSEIEKMKRQCARLFGEVPAEQPKRHRLMSMAEALSSMNPHTPCNSFADAVISNPSPSFSTRTTPVHSSEMIACISLANMYSPPGRSSEEIAVSALREFGNM